MKKIVLSYAQQVWILNALCGTSWLIFSIASLFDLLILDIISYIAIAAGYICIISVAVLRKQSSDEMSDANYQKAQAAAYTITRILVLISIIVLLFLPDTMTTPSLLRYTTRGLFAIIGISEITVGVLFKKYERE